MASLALEEMSKEHVKEYFRHLKSNKRKSAEPVKREQRRQRRIAFARNVSKAQTSWILLTYLTHRHQTKLPVPWSCSTIVWCSLPPSWALILFLLNLICYLTNFVWKYSPMKNLGREMSRTVLQVNLRRIGAPSRRLYLAPPQILPIYVGKYTNFGDNKHVGHLRVLNEKLKAFMRSLYKTLRGKSATNHTRTTGLESTNLPLELRFEGWMIDAEWGVT